MFPMSDKDNRPNFLERLGRWYAEWLKRPEMVPVEMRRQGTDDTMSPGVAFALSKAPVGSRYYGSDGTIHQTGEVNVELFEGFVVAVWFRCATLPFTQTEVEERRAEQMYQGYREDEPDGIEGIVFTE